MADTPNEEKLKLEDLIMEADDFKGALHTELPDRPKMPPAQLKAFMQKLPLEVSMKQVNGIIRYLLSSDWATDLKVLNVNGEEISLQELLNLLNETDTDLQENIDDVAKAAVKAEKQLQQNIDAEAKTRAEADSALGEALSTEEKARIDKDKDLQAQIAALIGADIDGGIVVKVNEKTGIVILTGMDIENPLTGRKISEDLKELFENPIAIQERTELDDMQIMTGVLINAGAGWNSFVFPPSSSGVQVIFDETPQVFLQVEDENTTVNIRNVTKTGFQYQVRKFNSGDISAGNVSTGSYFTASAAAASSAHTAVTLVNDVVLPSFTLPRTTTDRVNIHWAAISRKY